MTAYKQQHDKVIKLRGHRQPVAATSATEAAADEHYGAFMLVQMQSLKRHTILAV